MEADFSYKSVPLTIRSGFNGRLEFDWFLDKSEDEFTITLPARLKYLNNLFVH